MKERVDGGCWLGATKRFAVIRCRAEKSALLRLRRECLDKAHGAVNVDQTARSVWMVAEVSDRSKCATRPGFVDDLPCGARMAALAATASTCRLRLPEFVRAPAAASRSSASPRTWQTSSPAPAPL